MKPSFVLTALLSLASMFTPASAHHSFAAFDRNATVVLAGTVKEFQFANPHIWIQLIVRDERARKDVEWSLEGPSPNGLRPAGWKPSTLKPGDKARITINPLKDGSPGGAIVEIEVGGKVFKTKY
jgi:hypothetical protein